MIDFRPNNHVNDDFHSIATVARQAQWHERPRHIARVLVLTVGVVFDDQTQVAPNRVLNLERKSVDAQIIYLSGCNTYSALRL